MEALALAAVLFAKGFEKPVSLKFDAAGTAYIVEQKGRVVTVKDGKPGKVVLDISDRTTKLRGYSEQGLLDIALHPEFSKNGRLFSHYTDRKGDTVVSEFACKEGVCDPKSEMVFFTQDQPHSNHNGGQLEFGPGGLLYLGLGDGGSAGDPHGNGQSHTTKLAKIITFRLDEKEPTVATLAMGLRNPWRFSFDGMDLYIADVGQNRWEEINLLDMRKLDRKGPPNFGWGIMEGNECFRGRGETCNKEGLKLPLVVYSHDEGDCSVTGGYVFKGHYFYSDYCTGNLWSIETGKAEPEPRSWNELNPKKSLWGQVSSFGKDSYGGLYLVSYERGSIVRFEAK